MIAVITGGRTYNEPALVKELDRIESECPGFTLFVGCCPSGADKIAREWAASRAARCNNDNLRAIVFEAEWDRHLLRAGPIRNETMMKTAASQKRRGRGVQVLACPGGNGTENAVEWAHRLGLHVKPV